MSNVRFAAAALLAAMGNKPAAIEAAGIATARAVYLCVETGNIDPLREAVKAIQRAGKSARAQAVRAAFTAAIGTCAALALVGDVIADTRTGKDKRAGKEAAQVAERAALQGFALTVGAMLAQAAADREAAKSKTPDNVNGPASTSAPDTAPAADVGGDTPATGNASAIKPADAALMLLAGLSVDALRAALERVPAAVVALAAQLDEVTRQRAADALAAETLAQQHAQAAADAMAEEQAAAAALHAATAKTKPQRVRTGAKTAEPAMA